MIGKNSATVITSISNFLLNEQERNRHDYSANADDKTIQELYLWPWADAVNAGLMAVECGYVKINGTHCCNSSQLLTANLKSQLGYPGLVFPDRGANVGLPGAPAGVDFDGHTTVWTLDSITEYIEAGSMTQERLDDMAIRTVLAHYFVGLDQAVLPSSNIGTEDVGGGGGGVGNGGGGFTGGNGTGTGPGLNGTSPLGNGTRSGGGGFGQTSSTSLTGWRDARANHSALIRKIGAQSFALLKNNIANGGGLPLKKPRTISLSGSHAGPGVLGRSISIYFIVAKCHQLSPLKVQITAGVSMAHPAISIKDILQTAMEPVKHPPLTSLRLSML